MEEPKLKTAQLKVPAQSMLFGVSVRGWMAVTLTVTVCALAFMGKAIDEKIFALASLAIGFYFGQKNSESSGKPPEPLPEIEPSKP